MSVTITTDLSPILDALRDFPAKTRTSLAKAMNTTVDSASTAVVGEMRRVFDRPTPWALGALKTEKASPNSLEAMVRVKGKSDSGSAVPATSFLRAEIDGGQRRFKRFEVALFKAGAMPAGYKAVPASGARIDAFGNMSSGQIVQLLSYFNAFPEAGYRANSTTGSRAKLAKGTKKRRGYEYFAVGDGRKGLAPGIYQRADFGGLGRGVRPVLIFVKSASYRARLDFFGVGRKVVEAELVPQFIREMEA